MKKTYLLAGLGVGILALSAVSVALASESNYGAWRAMMGNRGGRAASVVTEKNYDQFAKMHQLMAEGKFEEAQKIRTDLGLGQGRGNGVRGCGLNGGNAQGGGCPMHNGGAGRGTGFVDANNNGICDHMEQVGR